jgi:hypothetical protein
MEKATNGGARGAQIAFPRQFVTAWTRRAVKRFPVTAKLRRCLRNGKRRMPGQFWQKHGESHAWRQIAEKIKNQRPLRPRVYGIGSNGAMMPEVPVPSKVSS